MSVTWIQVDPSVKKGIELVNTLELNNFGELLEKIINSLNDNSNDCLSLEHIQKTEQLLSLNSDKVKLILRILKYLVEKAWNFVMKPTVLQENLENILGLDQSKAELFVKLWTNQTKPILGDIKNNESLEKIAWQLNIQISSNMQQKHAIAKSILQLDLETDSSDQCTSPVTVEMDSLQLTSLYNQLEHMQQLLDDIKK